MKGVSRISLSRYSRVSFYCWVTDQIYSGISVEEVGSQYKYYIISSFLLPMLFI